MRIVSATVAVLALAAGTAGAADWSFGSPVNLGPAVNSSVSDGSPDVSADGLELFFSSARPGGYGGNDLYVATRPNREAAWGPALNLGPIVNTAAAEATPTVSADGLSLYFCDPAAPRPGGFGNSDLWVTMRPFKGGPWGAPVNLGPLVNSPSNEITPEVGFDGLEIYFESDRPGGLGSDDLWAARRATRRDQWGGAEWLGPVINSPGMEHCANLSADGLTLFFDFTPPGGTVGDLMVSTRRSLDSAWEKPVNLGHVLSTHWASSIDSGGDLMYFASSGAGGVGGNDLWQVSVLYDAARLARP